MYPAQIIRLRLSPCLTCCHYQDINTHTTEDHETHVQEQATGIQDTIDESHKPDIPQPSHAVAGLGAVEGISTVGMDDVSVNDNDGKSTIFVCHEHV